MTITCLNPSSIQKRNTPKASKANPSSSSDIGFPLTKIYDHIWSLTTNNETVKTYELFDIWNYLEIELSGNTSINSYSMADIPIVHSQKSKQHEFLEEINKDQAFNILYQSIVSSNTIIPRVYDNNLSTDCNSEDDFGYNNSTTVTEKAHSTPSDHIIESKKTTTQHCGVVSKKLQLGAALEELEELHAKLNEKYITIENKLCQLERNNTFNVKELETLTKRNFEVSERISNIHNELLASKEELLTIKYLLHFGCLLGSKSYEFLLSLLSCYLLQLLLKGLNKVQRFSKIQVGHLSPANTAKQVHIGSNSNLNIRLPCEFLSSMDIQE